MGLEHAITLCRLSPVDGDLLNITHMLLSMLYYASNTVQSLYAALLFGYQACVHMFPFLALLAV